MFATIAFLMALGGPVQAPATAAAAPLALAVQAQEHAVPAVPEAAAESHEFDILHHILDAREIETPFGVIHLPAKGSWMLGPIDITPTKHVVFLWLVGVLVLLLLIPAAQAAKRRNAEELPRKRHNAIEALALFFRDNVVMPNIGHGGERYVPFVLTLFFFILISNLLGLLPWGSTATANISVTAGLALLSFVMIEAAGMRALGPKGYLGTIVYVPKGLPKPLVPIMAAIMTPVELLGKLAKPFALAMRLMANMTAGHIVMLALISLIFVFGSFAFAAFPVVMAVAMSFLEIFVAFLQAFIFSLLTSVFIGLITHAH
jgi:F-type H+-transporting ATPase subunit a